MKSLRSAVGRDLHLINVSYLARVVPTRLNAHSSLKKETVYDSRDSSQLNVEGVLPEKDKLLFDVSQETGLSAQSVMFTLQMNRFPNIYGPQSKQAAYIHIRGHNAK